MCESASLGERESKLLAVVSDIGMPTCFAASLITELFNCACCVNPIVAESTAVGSPVLSALTRFMPALTSFKLELFVTVAAANAAPVKSPLLKAEATAAYCTGRIKSSGIVMPICGDTVTKDEIIPCKLPLSKAYKS